MLIETLATEESPVPRRHQILRRPKKWCRLTYGIVGLLRMTATGEKEKPCLRI